MIFAVLFCFAISMRIIGNQPFAAGDTIWHYSNELHLIRSIEQGQGFFSCFDKGAGIPALSFYQPLLYMLTALIYFSSFKLLNIYFIHNLLVCILFSLFPAAVFYCARSFKFTRFTSGIISLFTLFPISGWGHTVNAYFVLGLDTQLIGTLCFTAALGALCRLSRQEQTEKNLYILSISISCLILGHAVYALLLAYTLPAYLIVFWVYRGNQQMYHLIKKLLFSAALIACITGFWAVPFVKHTGEYRFKSTVELSGSRLYSSFTPYSFFSALFLGELLDTPHSDSALSSTGNTEFRWPAVSVLNRYGIFTLFSVLGFLMLIGKRMRFRSSVFAILFLWSIVLLLGADDIPPLRFLPFIDEFQCIRSIFLFELMCCFAAGNLCSILYRAIWNMRRDRRIHAGLRYCLLASLSVLLCIPVAERFLYAQSKFSAHPSEQLNDLSRLMHTLPLSSEGRILYDEDSSALPSEFSSYSDCMFRASHLDNMLASSMMLGFNAIKRFIPHSPYLLSLFHIGFVVADSEWNPPATVQKSYRLLKKNRFFKLFSVPCEASLFYIPSKKPAGVWCSNETWYFLNQLWMKWHAEKGEGIAPLVKLPDECSLTPDLSLFSALILFDKLPDSHTGKALRDKIGAYQKTTGRVYGLQSLHEKPFTLFDPKNSAQLLSILSSAPQIHSPAVIQHGISRWNRYTGEYTASNPSLIIARKMYYREWQAHAQNTHTAPLQVSPGFIGFIAPAGSGTIMIDYRSSKMYVVLFISGVCIGVFLIFARKRLRHISDTGKRAPLFYHLIFPAVCGRITVVCGCIYLGMLCSVQVLFHTPSLIYPQSNAKQINPAAIVFRWNEFFAGNTYDFQLAGNRHFKDAEYAASSIADTFLVYRALLPNKQYYWRMRVHSEKEENRWSIPYKFTTTGY